MFMQSKQEARAQTVRKDDMFVLQQLQNAHTLKISCTTYKIRDQYK